VGEHDAGKIEGLTRAALEPSDRLGPLYLWSAIHEPETIEAAVGWALISQGLSDLHAMRKLLETKPQR